MDAVIFTLLGLMVGLGLLLWQRGRWLAENARLSEQAAGLQAALEAVHRADAGKAELLAATEAKLANAFNALSAEALARNNQAFLDLATQNLATFQEGAKGDLAAREVSVAALVKPIAEQLERLTAQTQAMEKTRAESHGQLSEQVRGLMTAQSDLRHETQRLVTALRRPEVRGRWGEVQLRRVVEMAGMVEHCDFFEQETGEDGKRPDMIVRLPGGKSIVVDSKAPLSAYLDSAADEDGKAHAQHMQRFAQHVRTHIQQLAIKAYWEQFQPAPEFVVLFLPGESFFSAALREDPELIEYASDRKVILATPTTLLALLKAVYYGWRQESLTDNARQVSALGAQLYERLTKLAEHWTSVGKNLGQAVKAYNDATGSLESRVLVTARRFEELRVAPEGKSIPAPIQVEQMPRSPQAPELGAD